MTSVSSAITEPPRGRAPLTITLVLAGLWVAVSLVWTVVNVLQDLLAPDVSVSTPISQFYPKVNPTVKVDGTTATMTGGGYDHATFLLSGLHLDARVLLAGGALLEGSTSLIIAFAIALLCRRLTAGQPFAATVTGLITLSGYVVLAGGLLWQVCNEWGQYLALQQAFQITGGQWMTNVKGITPTSIEWPHAANGFTIDFWPMGIAFVLFALAAVFRYGASVENERRSLRREVEGLV